MDSKTIFQPVYGSKDAIDKASKVAGKLYFSKEGGIELSTKNGSTETISYSCEKIDELLGEKVDLTGLDKSIQDGIVNQLEVSKEEFDKLKTLVDYLGENASDVTSMGEKIQANENNITSLQESKADKTTVDELSETVNSKADADTVTSIQSDVEDLKTSKADSEDLTSLENRVGDVESSVATKAESGVVTELDTKVSTIEETANSAKEKAEQLETSKADVSTVTDLQSKYDEDHGTIESIQGELANKVDTSTLEEEYTKTSEADEKYIKVSDEVTDEKIKDAITKADTAASEIETLKGTVESKAESSALEELKGTVEEDYLKTETADTKYLKVIDDEVTDEKIKTVITTVSPLKDVITIESGIDINLQSDNDTFSVVSQNGSTVEVGKAGNLRMTPAYTVGDQDDSFTEGVVLVDPMTNEAVAGIGFSGKVKGSLERAATNLTEVDYVYIGLKKDEKPLFKLTSEGKLYIGDDETDVVSKIQELESKYATLEGRIQTLESSASE